MERGEEEGLLVRLLVGSLVVGGRGLGVSTTSMGVAVVGDEVGYSER